MSSIKFGARNIKLAGLPENSNRNPYLQNQKSSSVSSISSSFLSRRCNKRAVLCGVSYSRKRKYRLKGTINDIMNMKELLVKVFDFPTESIRILTEQAQDPRLVPTKKNVLESMKWLVEGCQSGDSLMFYFAGHGFQHPDIDGDERDGLDESICPADFMREGTILDENINSILVWPLKEGVTLHVIVDACHSGTILDLRYVYDPNDCSWKDSDKSPAKKTIKKQTSGGRAICISACEDSQLAADTTAFRGKGMNGVMTYLFTEIIRKNPKITYKGLQEQMHEEIQDVVQNSCHPKFLLHFFRPKIKQVIDTSMGSRNLKDISLAAIKTFDISHNIMIPVMRVRFCLYLINISFLVEVRISAVAFLKSFHV